MGFDQGQGSNAVTGLSDDVHDAARRERAHESVAEQRVIFAHYHAHFFGRVRAGHAG